MPRDNHTSDRAALTRSYRKKKPAGIGHFLHHVEHQAERAVAPRTIRRATNAAVRQVTRPQRPIARPQQAATNLQHQATRQYRHVRRVKAHRDRVAIKKAQEVDRKGHFHDSQRAALTQFYRPTLIHPPSQGFTKGLPHYNESLFQKLLHVTGYDSAGNLGKSKPDDYTKALLHPLKTAKGLSQTRQQLDTANALDPSRSWKIPKRLAIDTPRALAEHPSAIPKTLKGLALLPISAPAAIAESVAHPGKTGKAVISDVNRRYFQESDKQFRDRIGKEGAAAEIADASAIAPGGLSVLGRSLGREARLGHLGEKLKATATEPRPRLRITGGVAREQDLSPNLLRTFVQRGEDKLRHRKTERANRRHPDRKPGMQPQTAANVLISSDSVFWKSAREALAAKKRGDHTAEQAALARGHRAEREFKANERRPQTGRPHEVVPLFSKRAQRVETSRIQSAHFQRFKSERAKHIDRGVMRELGNLSGRQRQAIFHALQGLVSPDNPDRAIAQLTRRRQRIVAEYKSRGLSGVPREAKTIDHLIEHADEIFTPKLRQFVDAERARHAEIGHVGVSDTVAAARRYRPQADELGIPYPYEQARKALDERQKLLKRRAPDANAVKAVGQEYKQAVQELEARRPEIDQQFVAHVREAAQREGLPEPVYVQHFKHRVESEGRSAFALGGTKAAAGVKRSDMELLRSGRAVTDPQAYVQSTARVLKRKHNWRLIADQADAHSFPLPDAHELRDVFGHAHVDPGKLTADQLHTLIEHRGLDPKDLAIWAPGRFQREVAHQASGDEILHPGRENEIDVKEVQAAVNDSLAPADQVPEGMTQTEGVRLIPREVYNEIHSAVQGSSAVGRVVDKIQGLQSVTLLGTNPGWLAVQIAANAFIAVAKTRGNVAAFVRAPAFYRRLAPEVRHELDDLFGTGPAEAHGARVHLGAATNNRMVDGYRAIREALSFKYQAAKNSVPLLRDLPSLNPVHLMFAVDNANNRYFTGVVLYDEMRRQAFRDMAHHGENALHLQGPLSEMLSLDPKGRIDAMLKDPEQVVKHAEAVYNVLGNYVRYTAKERRTLKRYTLFYGFMRYSLRMLFYTMPVKHPVTLGVVAKLAQMHDDEVNDLLGGSAKPWMFSKVYLGTDYSIDKNKWEFSDPAVRSGKKPPSTIDLARLNPVANPAVSVATEGVKAASSLFSPAFQIVMNQIYGEDVYTGRRYEPGESGWKIALNEALQLAFPYRVAEQATQPGPSKFYQSDTLLWDPKPKQYKTPAKRAEQRKAFSQGKENASSIIGQQLLPLLPRPDYSAQSAAHPTKTKKKKSGGGNLFKGGGSGGGSNGSF